jgi:hypothetical protein
MSWSWFVGQSVQGENNVLRPCSVKEHPANLSEYLPRFKRRKLNIQPPSVNLGKIQNVIYRGQDHVCAGSDRADVPLLLWTHCRVSEELCTPQHSVLQSMGKN